MSRVIHMETDTVLAASKQLSQTTEQMDIYLRTILDKVRHIPWESSSREVYLQDISALMKTAASITDSGEMLALRIQREVDEWTEIDQKQASETIAIGKNGHSIFTGDFFDDFRTIRGLVVPYSLSDVIDYLDDTEAGRQLIEEAYKAGVCFVLEPEGTLIGDPNGERVTIRFDTTDSGTRGYQRNNEIVISDIWYYRRESSDRLAETMGHEMQHAIDRQNGILQDYTGMENYLNDPAQLESFIEHRTETRIASEIRAWERGQSIGSDSVYRDDNITTPEETADLLYSKGYEKIYEDQFNEQLQGKYTVDCWTDSNGVFQVTLTPVQTLNTIA